MNTKFKKWLPVTENGIHLILAVDEEDNLKLLHFSSLPLNDTDIVENAIHDGFPFVSMELAGFDRPYERHEKASAQISYVYPEDSAISFLYKKETQELQLSCEKPISACVLKVTW